MRLQTTLMYRGSVIVFRLNNILILAVLVAVWLAAESKGLIGGYTKETLITYYFVGMFINSIVFWHSAPGIRTDITTGDLSHKALSKPVSYYWQKFFEELGWHTISPLFNIFATLVVGYFIRDYISLPSLNLASVIAIVSASFLFFNISNCLGLMAFWLTEAEGLGSFVWMGVFLLGGQAIPLSFFPGNVKVIIDLLPFRYIYSFPLEVYLRRLQGLDVVHGLFSLRQLICFAN